MDRGWEDWDEGKNIYESGQSGIDWLLVIPVIVIVLALLISIGGLM